MRFWSTVADLAGFADESDGSNAQTPVHLTSLDLMVRFQRPSDTDERAFLMRALEEAKRLNEEARILALDAADLLDSAGSNGMNLVMASMKLDHSKRLSTQAEALNESLQRIVAEVQSLEMNLGTTKDVPST